jgi:hypothetical protein
MTPRVLACNGSRRSLPLPLFCARVSLDVVYHPVGMTQRVIQPLMEYKENDTRVTSCRYSAEAGTCA